MLNEHGYTVSCDGGSNSWRLNELSKMKAVSTEILSTDAGVTEILNKGTTTISNTSCSMKDGVLKMTAVVVVNPYPQLGDKLLKYLEVVLKNQHTITLSKLEQKHNSFFTTTSKIREQVLFLREAGLVKYYVHKDEDVAIWI